MTKPELGTKRFCVHCDAKFYDLNQSPIACPKCGAVFEPMQGSTRWPSKAVRVPVREVEPVAAETQEVQFVSPEDDDAEAQSKKKSGEAHQAEDEAGLVDDLDDAAFIEEKEDTDVTEIIGGDVVIEKGT
jgi:uncharacterized protein (TIGR02300 family)